MESIRDRLEGAPRRRIILAACAFARTVEHELTDQISRDAIETAERYADGQATAEDVRAVAAAASWVAGTAARAAAAAGRVATEEWAAGSEAEAAAEAAAEAIAEAAKANAWAAWAKAKAVNELILDCILPPRIQLDSPVHVVGLATTIYDKRDWPLMLVLADALEEIGREEMAAHCRQPIHARGCHVLDSILADRFP